MSLKERLIFLLGLQHLEEYDSMIKEKCTISRLIVTRFLLVLKIKKSWHFSKVCVGGKIRGVGAGRGIHSLQDYK